MYIVEYTEAAKQDMKKIAKNARREINDALQGLTDNPYEHNIKKLKSSNNAPIFRYRIGNFRAIFTINDFKLVILVIKVGNRNKIYRKY